MSHPEGPNSYLFEKTETTEVRGRPAGPGFNSTRSGHLVRPHRPGPHVGPGAQLRRGPPPVRVCARSVSPIHRQSAPTLLRGPPPRQGCPFARPPMAGRGGPPVIVVKRISSGPVGPRHMPPAPFFQVLKDTVDRLERPNSAPRGGPRLVSLSSGPRMGPVGRPPMPPTRPGPPVIIKAIKAN